jgi:hypothetical protein
MVFVKYIRFAEFYRAANPPLTLFAAPFAKWAQLLVHIIMKVYAALVPHFGKGGLGGI